MSAPSSTTVLWANELQEPDPPEYTDAVDPQGYAQQRLSGDDDGRDGENPDFLRWIYTKTNKKKDITVRLYGQDEHASMPVYGKAGKVEGTIALAYEAAKVNKVVIKVEGLMRLNETNIFKEKYTLVDMIETLWEQPTSDSTPSLPCEIPFRLRIPAEYNIEGKSKGTGGQEHETYPLPPTCTYASGEQQVSSMFTASVEYSITVAVEMESGFKNILGGHSVEIPFRYFPRANPPKRHILPSDNFLETVKDSPEEWVQTRSIMKPRHGVCDPIDVHVILQNGFIYPLDKPLPFHIQLQGTKESLNYLSSSGVSSKNLTVRLKRTVGAIVHGDESLKPLETGNGVLKEVPDQSASKETHDAASAKDFLTMSWEGIVIPDGDLAGTFRSGVLYMKDYLVVTIAPEDTVKSPFDVHVHHVPICLA